jgi:splicing factor U2AF 35 kDa subunit
MAKRLATIYGTEQDKVNCPFYFKIGACRHGDNCSRLHNHPVVSETLLLRNMYLDPSIPTIGIDKKPIPSSISNEELQEHFENFYEDVFLELSNHGQIEEMYVCGNLGEHLMGNVYCKFHQEEEAEIALKALQGRFYGGRMLQVEYSPVTDFHEAVCRQFEAGECNRGGFCNFMHIKCLSNSFAEELYPKGRDYWRTKRQFQKVWRNDSRVGRLSGNYSRSHSLDEKNREKRC